ncbi:hypothetical protein HDU99_009958, partial [Rhizoclosmatium hyalinum]
MSRKPDRAYYLHIINTAHPGLGRAKEEALHNLFDDYPEPDTSSDREALSAIVSNAKEHTYIRAFACAVLARYYGVRGKYKNGNDWAARYSSFIASLTEKQLNEQVWIPVDNFFQQDRRIYIQVSLREYLDAPQGLLNQMLYLWNAGAEELYIPPDKLLD